MFFVNSHTIHLYNTEQSLYQFLNRATCIFHNAKDKSCNAAAEMLKIIKSTVGDIINQYKYEDRIDFISQEVHLKS